jgi:hypothetical protein
MEGGFFKSPGTRGILRNRCLRQRFIKRFERQAHGPAAAADVPLLQWAAGIGGYRNQTFRLAVNPGELNAVPVVERLLFRVGLISVARNCFPPESIYWYAPRATVAAASSLRSRAGQTQAKH